MISTSPDYINTKQRQRRVRLLLFMLVPLLVLAFAVYWLFVGGRYISTDNAYIKTDLVNISAEVNGNITAVSVRENQPVAAGELLLRIDTRPYEVTLQNALAQLEKARIEIKSMRATYAQKQSALAASQDDLSFARTQLGRVKNLNTRGAAAKAALDQAQRDLDVARNTVDKLRSESAETMANLGGRIDLPLEQHPTLMVAQAAVEKAELDLQRCELHAPIDGVASKVPKLGQYATPGLPMISVVADSNAWIEANFKEDQLKGILPGASVEVEIAAYPGERWTAKIQSIGQATGAEFALLPPQNATGNWVKVVQRLPVRLAIDHHAGESPLRAGLSADVTVDTGVPARMQAIYALLGIDQSNAVAAERKAPTIDPA